MITIYISYTLIGYNDVTNNNVCQKLLKLKQLYPVNQFIIHYFHDIFDNQLKKLYCHQLHRRYWIFF